MLQCVCTMYNSPFKNNSSNIEIILQVVKIINSIVRKNITLKTFVYNKIIEHS